MKTVIEELKEAIKGDVHDDPITRRVYSVDASIFEVEPAGIVAPATKEELIETIKILNARGLSVTARGAATGITGGCLGKGFIIDTSKSLNRVLEINREQGYVRCEPGVVQDDLNQELAKFGYRLGPDTSTGNRATLGGMLANNAAGSRSLRYGAMADHVLAVEMALAHGKIVRFHSLSHEEWRRTLDSDTMESRLYKAAITIKTTYREDILKGFPKIPRRVSGYNLDKLLGRQRFNLSKLIAGSEGTLGIVTEMTLRIVPKPEQLGLCLIYCDDMTQGMEAIPSLLAFRPTAFEMIDNQIIELGRLSPSLKGQLDWLTGCPNAIFILEFDGRSKQEVEKKLQAAIDYLKRQSIGYRHDLIVKPGDMAKVWKLRKAGLGILLSKRSYSRAIAFLEDISIPPARLAAFMKEFNAYLKEKGKSAGIYGHVGAGCMHIRPYIDLRKEEDHQFMRRMMLDISRLLVEYGGSLSGEHGDGLIRSWLNPLLFGERLTQAFIDLKLAFDPDNLMNPGKIVFPTPPFEDLRAYPGEKLKNVPLFLNFDKEGGFQLAVDLCNGNGLCRKQETVMCPSFQATKDEFHSTRARAQALRSIIHGRLPLEDFTSKGLHDVMDLCVSCKGCKTECPSQVDMAKMKAEFLYHYQEKHGYSFRSRLFGKIGNVNRLLSFFPALVNGWNQSFPIKNILSAIGVTTKRRLPFLAEQRFSKWFKSYKQKGLLTKRVVLFNDTFTEFNHPEIGVAAVKILNRLHYQAIVPSWKCCGRPAISKGLLQTAKKQALNVIDELILYARQGIPIIGLEPSCLLTIRDDYDGFDSSNNENRRLVASACLTLDEFLASRLDELTMERFKPIEQFIKVHGHCHQKASSDMSFTLETLNRIPGFQADEIQAGCCGMAGSFGYEAEHYDMSMKMGELKLFPAIRMSDSSALLIANGTSCRQQIKDGTGRQALHLAQALFAHLEM